jgi:hypothetical protein
MKVIVHLTGGLGNQLFQLAAALSMEADHIHLMTQYGNPRGMEISKPDLTYFKLPGNVKVTFSQKKSRFIQKTISFLIRLSTYSTKSYSSKALKLSLQKCASFILSLLFMEKLNVYLCNGIGFSGKLPRIEGTTLLVGYFQCATYFEEVKVNEALKNIAPDKINDVTQLAKSYSENKSILIMHVRLGDYRSEEDFGILSKEFYQRALLSINNKMFFDELWLFSDEIESAKLLIPKNMYDKLRILDNEKLSAGEVLELMRYGNGYIIANSSLSWWGASLSYNKNPIVLAPSPWFKKMGTPEKLIPSSWSTLSR